MITEASYSDNLRSALAYVNNRPERASRWPERWMIHRPDGSFALYHVNWGVRSTASKSRPVRRWSLLLPPHNPRTKKAGFWSGCTNERSPLFRDEEMTERDHIQVREEQANRYASREDFQTIFSEHLNELYQLSFLLTRDPARAERCPVSGREDCVTGNRAFREWARSWAKRTIVQNAIRELTPRPIHSNSPLSETILPDIANSRAVQADISQSTLCWALKISSDLCSSCPSWSTTRNTTVAFSSGAQLEKFERLVAALLRN